MYFIIKLQILWTIIAKLFSFIRATERCSESQICRISIQTMGASQVLTYDEKRAFIQDGYVVLRGAVPPEMVESALKVVDKAYAEGKYDLDESKFDPVPQFHEDVKVHPDLGEILERTKIFAAAEDLVGVGNALYVKKPQIAFRPKGKSFIENGMSISEPMPWYRYHIDGGDNGNGNGNEKLAGTATPFTLLIGVCLSPGQDIDENRGQFTAWPGKFSNTSQYYSSFFFPISFARCRFKSSRL